MHTSTVVVIYLFLKVMEISSIIKNLLVRISKVFLKAKSAHKKRHIYNFDSHDQKH